VIAGVLARVAMRERPAAESAAPGAHARRGVDAQPLS